MQEMITDRGFQRVDWKDAYGGECSLQQSSAILEDTEKAFENPGSTGLWLGRNTVDGIPSRAHLNRQHVIALVAYLQFWLETGKLFASTGNREVTNG